MSSLTKSISSLIAPAILLFLAYTLVTLLSSQFSGWSVTALNVVSGIVVITLGSGLAVAGAMANDSGKGGFFIHTFQWLSLSYPMIYFVGLISSISVLYSEYENKDETAIWLASMSLAWLVLVAVIIENVKLASRNRLRAREINNQRKPYLVHLPHCGTMIPDEYIGDYLLSQEKLEQNVIQYADLYTDKLFEPLLKRFGGVKNIYSRLLFDPERFFDDEKEGMCRLGLVL